MQAPSEIAAGHYDQRQILAQAAAKDAAARWAAVDPQNIAASWAAQVPELSLVVSGAQLAAASAADGYLDEVLEAQEIAAGSELAVDARSLAGVASDGRGLLSLLNQPAISALTALSGGVPLPMAMATGSATLDMIVHTQVADAGRVADGVALTGRKQVEGYVRLLSPPSCSRCVILAGKHYRWNAGFQRHPRCDCVHIPAQHADIWHLRADPETYFHSLSQAEQDRIFTRAGAQAIRDGADMNQLVNARRSMYTASVGGRKFRATLEGTTVRGTFGAFETMPDGSLRLRSDAELQRRRSGSRHIRAARAPRLMPEEIYKIAGDDRDEAIRLLRRNGYLIDRRVVRTAPRLDLPAKAVPAPVVPAKAVPVVPAKTTVVEGAKAMKVPNAHLETRVTNPEASILHQVDEGVLRWRNGRPVGISQAKADELSKAAWDYMNEFDDFRPSALRAAGGVGRATRLLDEMLDTSPLDEGIRVWRGLDRPRMLFGDAISGDLTGVTVTERALMSTSTARSSALEYARAGGSDSGLVMHLTVKPGVNAVAMGGDQREILLQRGLRLHVTSDRRVRGVRVLEVEVEPVPTPTLAPGSLSPQTAAAMQRRMLSEHDWTPQQREALREYSAGWALEMNQLLRTGKLGGVFTEKFVRDAQAAMRPLPESVTLHRFVHWDALGVKSASKLPGLVGKVVQDRGFGSATIAESGWPDEQMVMAAGRKVRMEISAPAGTPAAYIEAVSAHPGQWEMLLGAGMKYRITAVVQVGGQTVVKAVIVR